MMALFLTEQSVTLGASQEVLVAHVRSPGWPGSLASMGATPSEVPAEWSLCPSLASGQLEQQTH